jgi:hypothetical protein
MSVGGADTPASNPVSLYAFIYPCFTLTGRLITVNTDNALRFMGKVFLSLAHAANRNCKETNGFMYTCQCMRIVNSVLPHEKTEDSGRQGARKYTFARNQGARAVLVVCRRARSERVLGCVKWCAEVRRCPFICFFSPRSE